MSAEAKESMARGPALQPLAWVVGVWNGRAGEVFALETNKERACYTDTAGGESVAVFWYAPTRTAVAWNGKWRSAN